MTSRSKNAVVEKFRGMVQDAISCFADTRVVARTEDDNRGILMAHDGRPVPMKSSGKKVSVAFAINYRLIMTGRQWRVSTENYIHKVLLNGKPEVEFHWHPDDKIRVWFPHIHTRFSNGHHGKVHIPSGRVLVEDVLVCAYELGAQPRKEEWESLMVENKKTIANEMTWGAPSKLIYNPQS